MSPIDQTAVEFPNATKAVEKIPEATQAAFRGLCQCQAEAAQLVSRRARACLELPATLASCRSVPEVVRVQSGFVQTFWSDWLDAAQRVTAVWAEALRPQAIAASRVSPSHSASRPAAEEPDPMAVWEWWRTDMKGIVPRRSEGGGPATNGRNTH